MLNEKREETLHHYAAVHLNALAIDPAAAVSKQGGDCGPNIVRTSHATESGVIGNILVDLGIIAHDSPAAKAMKKNAAVK